MRHFKFLTNGLVGLALTGLLAACGSGTGGGDELGTAPATSPVPITQGNVAEGEILYDNYCSRCHSLQPHDPVGSPELAGMGDVIAVKLQDSHMGNTLSATELSDVIAFANQGQVGEPAPEPDPTQDPEPEPGQDPVPVDGQSVYDANCADCHRLGTYDTSGSPELAGKGSVVNGKIGGGHMGVSLSGDELTALIGWVDENTPVPTPTPEPTPDPTPDPTPAPAPTPEPLDGKTVYDANCAGCHRLGTYDTSGSPELAGKGSVVSGKLGSGHMGLSLTTEAVNALVDWIDQNSSAPVAAPAPDPDPTPAPTPAPQCGSCHGLPPSNTAHAVHLALPGVSGNCAVCHPGASAATHNDGLVDLAIAATYNAKTGAAAENPNGTPSCVTVSCHGGQTTPDWGTGSINVNTQCTSCHARGTTQYNSYNSGQHGRSDHTRLACTACHNTTSLAVNHFSRLDTPTMEGPASATVGGGTTRVNSYNASTQTCTTSCHGSERW